MDKPAQLQHPEEFNRNEAALQELSDNLSRDIFSRAATASSGEKFEARDSALVGRVHGSAIDETFVGRAEIEVKQKGTPVPIALGSDPVTVVPAMDQGAFSELVVKPLLEQASTGESSSIKPVDIKLALKDGEELSGKMMLSFDDVYAN